jgi:hypothetical protein
MVVISDRKLSVDTNSGYDYGLLCPTVVSFTDYYPFGFPMAERSGNLSGYRSGLMGRSRIMRFMGENNSMRLNIGCRPPVGLRFWSVDPLVRNYSGWSSFIFFLANPIQFTDPNWRKSLTYNETSKNHMNQYLKEQFWNG